MNRSAGCALVAFAFGLFAHSGALGAADIQIAGPIPGEAAIIRRTLFDVGAVGYQQTEFTYAGAARYFRATGPLTSNGRWETEPAGGEKYASRLMIYRPVRADRFNGTVYLEWMNVSNRTADINPDWQYEHTEIIRQGAVWIGVSAQAIGVNGTRATDPVRYGVLTHPGDSFSYDIFRQAGAVVREQSARLLPGFKVRHVVAMGESQSAGRLVTYINAVHPHGDAFDGFFIHSRGASGAALSQEPQPAVALPPTVQIRTDTKVPVFIFQAETDVANSRGQVRQPDSDRLRTWEVAGAAHADQYLGLDGATDDGSASADIIDGFVTSLLAPRTNRSRSGPTATSATGRHCEVPYSGGPHMWVANAALHQLHSWVTQRKPPANGVPLEIASREPFELARDQLGLVKGGIRTPYVDVPVAALLPFGKPDDCRIWGTTEPFSAAQLKALYGTPERFTNRWNAAASEAIERGFIVGADRERITAVGKRLAEAVR